MSWGGIVIADSSGEWVGNGIRLATEQEADLYVRNLAARWTLVREFKTVEYPDEPANYEWADGVLRRKEPQP